MSEELVLAVPRELLDTLGSFQGLEFDTAPYLEQMLGKQNSRFLPRSRAEDDPSFKQIIPYVLIRMEGRWLHYVRGKGSGEKRLVAKGSIGVGGHINPGDESLFDAGRDFYERAVQRELREELRTDGEFRSRIVALLNDDSTPVGRVHLGIVHVCELADASLTRREASLTELHFLTLEELQNRREQLESWSQICLDRLESLVDAGENPKSRYQKTF